MNISLFWNSHVMKTKGYEDHAHFKAGFSKVSSGDRLTFSPPLEGSRCAAGAGRRAGKAVHLTTVHSPGDVRIFLKECRTLAHAGYEVVLIAGGDKEEVREGVRIRGLNIDAGRRRRRMTAGMIKMIAAALAERGELYHFHDPELMPLGWLLKIMGKKVIYDVHEDYASSLRESDREWLTPFFKRLASLVVRTAERIGMGFYDAVVAATPKIGGLFPASRTVVIQNYPFRDELACEATMPYGQRPLNIVYAGGISERRGIREMIGAVGALGNNGGAKLLLAGKFSPPALRGEAEKLPGWKNVEYLGCLSRTELAAVFGRSRIGLVLLHPTDGYRESQPIKLFEYMSAGIPVVASDFPRWREIVATAGAGLLVNPLDETAVAAAVHWLLAHETEAEAMGRNGARAVAQGLNWDGEAKKLLALYEKLLEK